MSPSGPRRGGSSAATSRSRCCAGRRVGVRRRPRRPRWTRPSWWRPRSTRSPADPELLAAERERVRHLVVDDAQDLDPQQMELVGVLGPQRAPPCCSRATPTRPSSRFRGADPSACGHRRRRRSCSPSITAGHPPSGGRAAIAARLPGAGEGRHRVAPPGRGAGAEQRVGRAPPRAAPTSPVPRRRDGGRRAGGRARVHVRGAGGGLDRRPAAARAPHRRRAVVADGGARRARPGARSRCCGARCWPRASRSPRRPTSCRWPASPRSCRC